MKWTSITISGKLAFWKAASAASRFNYTQFDDVIFMYLFKCYGNPLAKKNPRVCGKLFLKPWWCGTADSFMFKREKYVEFTLTTLNDLLRCISRFSAFIPLHSDDKILSFSTREDVSWVIKVNENECNVVKLLLC